MKLILKRLILVSLILVVFNCKSPDPVTSIECVSGTIVGEKCQVVALKLDNQFQLEQTDWESKSFDTTSNETTFAKFKNVIGLLYLPNQYNRVGKRIFLHLRVATKEEYLTPCYADMPKPPKTRYMVIDAAFENCPTQ